MQARPFMKWVGGKRMLLPTLLDLLPRKIRAYYEPFTGGGALFFALAAEGRFERARLNDWNAELVTGYRVIRDFPEELIAKLTEVTGEYHTDPRGTFERWRALDPKDLDPITRATRLIFLNKTCFNGLYRVNKAGRFNAPFGQYKNPCICDAENVRACADVLGRWVSIKQGDFANACTEAGPDDVVYFDPPYVPLTPTSDFTSYTSEGFGLEAQKRLAALFKELAEKGVAVVASNSDTEVVRDLYAGFELHQVLVRRPINSKADGRGAVGELVIVGRRASRTKQWKSSETHVPVEVITETSRVEIDDPEPVDDDVPEDVNDDPVVGDVIQALSGVREPERLPFDIDDP